MRPLPKIESSPAREDLPEDRVQSAPPFSYCAVDYFGPWYIKEGRRELKRYGVLFTCLASRAVHLEVANSLTTDSFMNAYRRSVGRRGPVRQTRSDEGANFVGARNELQQALFDMDHEKLRTQLRLGGVQDEFSLLKSSGRSVGTSNSNCAQRSNSPFQQPWLTVR